MDVRDHSCELCTLTHLACSFYHADVTAARWQGKHGSPGHNQEGVDIIDIGDVCEARLYGKGSLKKVQVVFDSDISPDDLVHIKSQLLTMVFNLEYAHVSKPETQDINWCLRAHGYKWETHISHIEGYLLGAPDVQVKCVT